MNNDALTPLKYHKANILAILVCFGSVIITMIIRSDNMWARAPIWITGVFATLFFFRFKELNCTDEYKEIISKSTIRAFWSVVYFHIMLNPLMQIPALADELAKFPDFLKNFVLIQLGIVIFIREVIIFKSCKKNNIS